MPERQLNPGVRVRIRTDEVTGGFVEQQQDPPGFTQVMVPVPDHGEESYLGSNRLQGKRAFITGGDSGIGRAIAIAYAREGADVAIGAMPQERKDAETTAELVREALRTAVVVLADLTTRAACRDAVAQAVAGLGGLDILVNNAGYHFSREGSALDELSEEQIERVLRTNLFATIWVSQAALAHLGEGACIINTSSVQAYDPSEDLLDYAATKAAINNFTVNLAAQLGPRGIRVNAVAPGPIWTPLQPATRDNDHLKSFGVDTPLGRAGQPAELAPTYVFLASPREASYISATVIGVTGGKPVF